MQLAKTTAFTAALLLSSSALVAQEAETRQLQSVFVDIGGSAVLVPMDVALDACALDESTLQTVAQTRLEESGIDQAQFYAGMDSFMGTTGASGAGATSTDAAASADAGATMTAEGAGDTTQTADANATTNAGNQTTNAGNSTDAAVADASGAGADAAAGTETTGTATETATADASGAAAQDLNAAGAGVDDVQNVQTTAADTGAEANTDMATGTADPFLILATCQIDQARATELGIDTTQTATAAGFDAATLGIQSDVMDQ